MESHTVSNEASASLPPATGSNGLPDASPGKTEPQCPYMLPTSAVEGTHERQKVPDATSAQDPVNREHLVGDASQEEPALRMLSRLPAVTRPSLGDRFPSMNLAHASLQYFKDRAQSAQAYLPSPLRSVITAPAPADALPQVQPEVQVSDCEAIPASSPASTPDTRAGRSDGNGTPPRSCDSSMLSGESISNPPAFACHAPEHALCSEVPALPVVYCSDATSLASPSDELLMSTLPATPASSTGDAVASDPLDASPNPDTPLAPSQDTAIVSLSDLSHAADLPEASGDFPEGRTLGALEAFSPSSCSLTMTANTGESIASTQARDGLGKPPTVSHDDSIASEVTVSLLAPSAPSSAPEIVVTGTRSGDSLLDADAHIPPEALSSDTELLGQLVESSASVLPESSEGVSVVPLPPIELQDAPSIGVNPACDLAALVSPGHMPASLIVEVLATVPESSREACPVIATELLSDKSVVHCVPELLADQTSDASSEPIGTHEASNTTEAIAFDGATAACGEESAGAPECGIEPATIGAPEDHCSPPSETLEGPTGGERSILMGEDVTPSTLSGEHNESVAVLIDSVLSETSCTTKGPDTQICESLSSEHACYTDGDQLVCTNEMIVDVSRQPDEGDTLDVPDVGHTLVEMPTAGLKYEDAMETQDPFSPDVDDLALMQVYEVELASSPMDIAADDLGPVEDFRTSSPPLPPSSPPYLSSSPLRSSSPPFMFSSPPSKGFNSSLPTSPMPSPPRHRSAAFDLDEGPICRTEEVVRSAQWKRALDDIDESDDGLSSFTGSTHAPMSDAREAKRIKLDEEPPAAQQQPPPPPQVKRPTFASQLRERRKLVAPFRSPLVDKDAAKQGVHAVYASGRSQLRVPAPKRGALTQKELNSPAPVTGAQAAHKKLTVASGQAQLTKATTPKVAKQFKSPFHLDASGSSSGPQPASTFSSVQAVPTIRALQSRIQTLKQAIKIKNAPGSSDDDELEELVSKWTSVGREVAWAVWDTVKDLGPGEGARFCGPNGGWGGDDNADCGRGGGWGYDDGWAKTVKHEQGEEDERVGSRDEEEEADARTQHTLGTMLRHLGIAPDTLGWDEEEGDFVDVE